MPMPASKSRRCVVCGSTVDRDEQIVLAQGRRRGVHCSEECVEESIRRQRKAGARRRFRALVSASLVGLALAGALTARRHRVQPPRSISYAWPEAPDRPARPEPGYFGPAWPPTDDDWMFAFDRASWVYPLPGPNRRAPAADGRIFSVGTARKGAVAVCRKPELCGVALGGDLWGEHVYAVQEGVVDHASGAGSEESGGGYVRIAHFGGMVFTQYFHLAAIPRGIVRGAHVSAGEVIGLLGDTGVGAEGPRARAHLHFALSILPRSDLQETYWDPTPLMARWPLRVPAHGTVAGLVAATDDMETPRRHRAR
jgi:murein DD-endopeptidase MepM/ murein hydrolase activator NlpD